MAITPKSEDKYVEKCSTAQSFILTEMSTYRIGTLVLVLLPTYLNLYMLDIFQTSHNKNEIRMNFNLFAG